LEINTMIAGDLLKKFLSEASPSSRAFYNSQQSLEQVKKYLNTNGLHPKDAKIGIDGIRKSLLAHFKKDFANVSKADRSIPFESKAGKVKILDSMRIVNWVNDFLKQLGEDISEGKIDKNKSLEQINKRQALLEKFKERVQQLKGRGKSFLDQTCEEEPLAREEIGKNDSAVKSWLEKLLKKDTAVPKKQIKRTPKPNPGDATRAKQKPQQFSLDIQNQAAKILAIALKQADPVLRQLKAEYPKQKFSSSAYTDIVFMIAARKAQSDLRNAKRSAVAECIEDAAARSGSSTAVKAAKLGRDAVANPQRYKAAKADTSSNAALGMAAEVVTAISGAGTAGMLAKGIWELLKALVVYTATSNRMSPGL
jgi:hypothetical protein